MTACNVNATTGRKRAPRKKPVIKKPTGTQPTTEQPTTTATENPTEISVPSIQPTDYLADSYLKNIYIFDPR